MLKCSIEGQFVILAPLTLNNASNLFLLAQPIGI